MLLEEDFLIVNLGRDAESLDSYRGRSWPGGGFVANEPDPRNSIRRIGFYGRGDWI